MAKTKTKPATNGLRKGERVKLVDRSGDATPVGIGRLMAGVKIVRGTFVAVPSARKKKRKAKRKAS